MDKIDAKILTQLDKNSRQSFSEIAKNVRISKEVCIYRINRLVNQGIIKQFTALISLGNLGLFSHKIYLQLHGIDTKQKTDMLKDLISNRRINWIAECVGEYDIIIAILCPNIIVFEAEKNKIIQKYSQFIHDYSIGFMTETRIYERAYLINSQIKEERYLIGELNQKNLDEHDKEILTILINDSRTSIIHMAKKLKLNVKTIVTRIKSLESNIIRGYKIFLDLDKMNYSFYKALIKVNNMDESERMKFLEFCKMNPYIIHLVENVGQWEFEPEFEVPNDKTFYDTLTEIKQLFPNFIGKISIVKIVKEHKAIYNPVSIINNS